MFQKSSEVVAHSLLNKFGQLVCPDTSYKRGPHQPFVFSFGHCALCVVTARSTAIVCHVRKVINVLYTVIVSFGTLFPEILTNYSPFIEYTCICLFVNASFLMNIHVCVSVDVSFSLTLFLGVVRSPPASAISGRVTMVAVIFRVLEVVDVSPLFCLLLLQFNVYKCAIYIANAIV